MTDNNEQAQTDDLPCLSEEDLWGFAKKYHEMMCEEIEQPGDIIGVCAIMFTNMLIGGVLSGADPKLVAMMLHMVGEDVQKGIERLSPETTTVQ